MSEGHACFRKGVPVTGPAGLSAQCGQRRAPCLNLTRIRDGNGRASGGARALLSGGPAGLPRQEARPDLQGGRGTQTC